MKADVEKKPKAKDGKALAQSWPASKVAIWPLTRVKPYARNARTHPQEEIDALARDMVEDGVTAPIFVEEVTEEIIYGHARRLAAIKNGFTRYPVVVAVGWTTTQVKAARIKDNQRALMGGWDEELLRIDVTELKLEGYDLALLAFPEQKLVQFLAAGPDAPEQFTAFGEDIPTAYCCPRCNYKWSGNPDSSEEPPAAGAVDPKAKSKGK